MFQWCIATKLQGQRQQPGDQARRTQSTFSADGRKPENGAVKLLNKLVAPLSHCSVLAERAWVCLVPNIVSQMSSPIQLVSKGQRSQAASVFQEKRNYAEVRESMGASQALSDSLALLRLKENAKNSENHMTLFMTFAPLFDLPSGIEAIQENKNKNH